MRLTLDETSEASRFAEQLERSFDVAPMLLELDLTVARRRMYELAEPLSPSVPVKVEDRHIRVGNRRLGARIFVPETIGGVYLHIHGGGWCIGSSRTQDARLGLLATESQLVVVSVDYRLAPEHPFPAALEDCVTAVGWALESVEDEFGSPYVLLGGESAGAHLATLTLINLRDRSVGLQQVRGINLAFGVFDLGLTPSQRLSGTRRVGINTALLERCYSFLLPGSTREERRAPSISPLFADLQALPPALFTVGGRDLLLDDTLFMAARWRAAGNEATLKVYPEALHGFLSHPIAVARLAETAIQRWLHQRATAPSEQLSDR